MIHMKLRGRSKIKHDSPSFEAEESSSSPLPISSVEEGFVVKPAKSKSRIWRLFSRRSAENNSPANKSSCEPSSVSMSAYEGGTILEEEYQDSLVIQKQLHARHQKQPISASVNPNFEIPVVSSGWSQTGKSAESMQAVLTGQTRHTAPSIRKGGSVRHATHHSTTAALIQTINPPYIQDINGTAWGHFCLPATRCITNLNSIYNEPCDAKTTTAPQTFVRKSTPSYRRASLAGAIYCDTEHHKTMVKDLSPPGSSESLRLKVEVNSRHCDVISSSSQKRLSNLSINFSSAVVPPTTINQYPSSPTALTTAPQLMMIPPSGYDIGCHFNIDSGSNSSVSTSLDPSVHASSLFEVSSSFSAGDVQPRVTDASPCFSMHQSEEVSASSRNHNLQQHKRHISPPIDRRRLSPHFRPSTVTSPHHAVSVSPSNSTCLMQGNTIISHHPASLFAPLPRVSLGRPTSPPAISSRVNDLPQIAPQCYSPTSVPPTVDEQTLSPSHDSPVLIKTLSADSSPPVNDIKVTFFNQPRKTSNQESTGHHNQQHRTNRKPSRQGVMQAAYEEAWDVKMTRRLGGMDVSRLTGSTMEQSKKDQEPNLSPNQFQRAAGYRASDRPRLTTTSVKAGHEKRASLSPSPSSSALKFLPTSTEMGEENGIEKFRNSSTDAVSSRELVISPFRLKHNQEKLPSSPKRQISTASELLATGLSSDYDYAYNRSWNMGVQLSLSMNLAHGSSDSSSDQAGVGTPTAAGDTPRNSFYGEEHQKTIAASPPPPPPHRSSCMTPVMTQFSPKSPQATPRGVHNPLACLPSASPTKVYEGEDGVVRTPESSTTMSTTSGVLPNSARQLADWDYTSSDSCYDEPWEIRQKRLVAQLTSRHYIDPQELVSEVAASTSKNGNCRDTNQQLLFNGNPLSNGVDVQTSAGSGATSPSFSSHLTTNSSPPPRCRSPNTSRSPPPPLPPHDLKPLHEQPWYHPNLTRIGAEELLRNSPEGSFVVRLSETIKNDFSLTVKHMGFLHMKITRDAQGFYILGEYSQPYSSIPQMISHYGSSQVPIRGATSVSLCHPR